MGILRLLFAIFVIFYHCGQFSSFTFMQGPEAVQSFYVISGFYMALILNEKYTTKNSYKLFISNRFLRLFPTYWIVLLIIVIFSVITIILSKGSDWGLLLFYKDSISNVSLPGILFLILSNLFVFGQDLAMYLGIGTTGNLYFTANYALTNSPKAYEFLLVPQAWTIALELMFYLIAPFIARKSVAFITILLIISASVKLLLIKVGLTNDPWSYRFFPAEMMYFLLGILSYKTLVYYRKISLPKNLLLGVLIATIAVVLFYTHLHYYIRVYLYFVGLAIAIPLIFLYTKNIKWDREIGEYSYPVYISHVFFKSLVFYFGFSGNVSLHVLISSLIFSVLINKFILHRIENFRQARVLKLA